MLSWGNDYMKPNLVENDIRECKTMVMAQLYGPLAIIYPWPVLKHMITCRFNGIDVMGFLNFWFVFVKIKFIENIILAGLLSVAVFFGGWKCYILLLLYCTVVQGGKG